MKLNFLLALCCPVLLKAQQVKDTSFHAPAFTPQYKQGSGPLVLFDEGHYNPHTLKGRYAAFGEVLRQDGYRLEKSTGELGLPYLQHAQVFVSANALYDPADWNLPARSAFAAGEVKALHEWVQQGGSLFLITDHMPCAASVNDVAQSFGFNLINGFAQKKDRGKEMFSRSRNNLHSNSITNGRNEAGRVDSFMIWGGTGFIAPAEAEIISSLGSGYEILLPSKAEEITDTTPRVSGLGFVNAAYRRYGKGKVVIFGDGAAFTAQLEGIYNHKRGMNHPDAGQNMQLLLNIMHWLSEK
ncbi:DUF4350 domain-containing protein [Chitinophaga sp. YIM B06452]|uniref:DUF4350 domain-containing protein n=1 Tax=Chitinophaga sp. YIM B06452 TaxID=3082158 RepID=UPI0031FF0C4E